ncbi:MAG: hypothetical protein GX221_06405 [Candidatus Riflebacteria bacterium]|mgnify:CR=1 FL=1|nr:hypothetical protein [Candidatus Riflebacteria bacterium]
MKLLLACRGKKDGVIALIIVAAITIFFIIFALLQNRVRQEPVLTEELGFTTKISDEMLCQFASSLGEFIADKIVQDLEYSNLPVYSKFSEAIAAISSRATSTPISEPLNFSLLQTEINDKAVEDALGKISKEAKLPVKLEDISLSLENVVSIDTPLCEGSIRMPSELLGELVIDVKFTIGDVRKTYKTVKDFKHVCLIPYPYARFTLFAPNFAGMEDNRINGVCMNDRGIPQASEKPLLCVNKRTKNNPSDYNSVNDTDNDNIVGDLNRVIENGWIYLGGAPGGQAAEKLKDFRLDENKTVRAFALNCIPGHGSELPLDGSGIKYGESYHFYNDRKYAGWCAEKNWSDFFAANGITDSNFIFVKFGLYDKLFDMKMKYESLADGIMNISWEKIYEMIPHNYSNGSAEPDFGSSLRIPGRVLSSSILPFGNSKFCTPTLIFGPVLRRYFTSYGLHTGNKILFFPYPSPKNLASFKDAINTFISRSEQKDAIQQLFNQLSWYAEPEANYEDYFKTSNGRPSLSPRVNDTEAYMCAYENLCSPLSPQKNFVESVYTFPGNEKFRVFTNSKNLARGDLQEVPMFGDFDFSKVESENYIPYRGTLGQLDNSLLKGLDFGERVSYELKLPEGESDFNISSLQFFRENYVNDSLFLNQVVKIDLPPGGRLIIDKPVFVRAGGIIDCGDGDILIKAPIISEEISVELSSDMEEGTLVSRFPFLTLVGKNIVIDTGKDNSELKALWDATVGSDLIKLRPYALPQLHAILIAKGTLKLEEPFNGINIVGSVAANNLDDSFLYSGSILEWGLEPNQMSEAEIHRNYGLSISSRIKEVLVFSD